MNEDTFYTVFDLIETGYRGQTWALVLGGLLFLGAVYVFWLKPQTPGDRVYRYTLAALLAAGLVAYSAYQVRTYGKYRELVEALQAGAAERTVGHISAVWSEGHSLYFDVGGRRMRTSRYEWPYRLGFHPGEFPLQPTFLVRVDRVGDVVVRLQVHRAHLE